MVPRRVKYANRARVWRGAKNVQAVFRYPGRNSTREATQVATQVALMGSIFDFQVIQPSLDYDCRPDQGKSSL